MLAINHVTLATAGAMGLSLYLQKPIYLPFIIFVAFAALLPDIDHPKSEISNFFPMVNKLFGHRQFTHSLLGTGLFGLGTQAILGHSATWVSIFLIVCAGIGVWFLEKLIRQRLSQIKKGVVSYSQLRLANNVIIWVLYTFLVILAVLIWRQQSREQILTALIFGYAAHLVGDFVTIEGIPLFFPWKQKFGLRLFRTGGQIESAIGACLWVANIVLLWEFSQRFGLSRPEYWVSVF